MKCIFHYNGDMANIQEEVLDYEYTYHNLLTMEDGKTCEAYPEAGYYGPDGKFRIEVYFDDGNELTVYEEELQPV